MTIKSPTPLRHRRRRRQFRFPHAFSPPHHFLRRHRQPHHPCFPLKLVSKNTSQNHCVDTLQSIVSNCKPKPFKTFTKPSPVFFARLQFRHRADALDAVAYFWEKRLSGHHLLTPVVDFQSSGDVDERVRQLFLLHVKKLLHGESVEKLEREVRPDARRKSLCGEMDGIYKRKKEFKRAMNSVRDYLKGNEVRELRVFKFTNEEGFNWGKLHHLLLRECRRLEDGLPIYGFRLQILKQILSHKVIVLAGVTGSGKSTQLVQYILDAGVASGGCILCTQPHKVAAITLAKRVGEETIGCYEDKSVTCHQTYSSPISFDSEIIYMTDHCLVQHLMENRTLSGVSCIIVDEAHERSLDTDLLLAFIKLVLKKRRDLILVIMSTTGYASKICKYFGCRTLHVKGRGYPVEIKYVRGASEGPSDLLTSSSSSIAPYVSDVVNMALKIHREEKDGGILAFLTSQIEVERACEKFLSPDSIALPLHGKLSQKEQSSVFQNYPGKRKVIFATNIAERSLTIPGVKFVVDSGKVKESRFEPSSGMNVLRVCKISQSSADQRAGRAGRTEPGKCYRLYSESDYLSMDLEQEPEIRKVHLGTAVLRILALGIKNVLDVDFLNAPSATAVDVAINNLLLLGAVVRRSGEFQLNACGTHLVKLGIEARLGKIIFESYGYGLLKEGVVLAAVTPNASSIFCRVGPDDDKLKSESCKFRFCHSDGDLFTLLNVYKEWESVCRDNRNAWCRDNSVNGKTMRRCRETVVELENCLKNLHGIVPTSWVWSPLGDTRRHSCMKKIVLAALADNVAMYSGNDRLGYEVLSRGECYQLHPSCSLKLYSQKPAWAVFAELLSTSCQYMVCVTAIDFDSLSALSPPPFDISSVQKLQVEVIKGFSGAVLRNFCGKGKANLLSLLSGIRVNLKDNRIGIEVDVENNEVLLYASAQAMQKVYDFVNDELTCEVKWLSDECLKMCMKSSMYREEVSSLPVALFGAGAEIRHLELEDRCLSLDVFVSKANDPDDKEILSFFKKSVSGVCGCHRFSKRRQEGDRFSKRRQEGDVIEKWGRVTFLSPEAAENALDYDGCKISSCSLKLYPSRSSVEGGNKSSSFPALEATVTWPRRYSKGCAVVRCEPNDAEFIIKDCRNLRIGDRYVDCEDSTKEENSVILKGLDRDTSEPEMLGALRRATNRKILDAFLVRGDAVSNPPTLDACKKALLKEISPFMPNQAPLYTYCRVDVLPPKPNHSFMKARITFDGGLHLEAAKALKHIQGKVLACCLSWQKMQCHLEFRSFFYYVPSVHAFLEGQLKSLILNSAKQSDVYSCLQATKRDSYKLTISASATMRVAELRRPVERLLNGRLVNHDKLTPAVLRLLNSEEGTAIVKSLNEKMGTWIVFDRSCVRIYGEESRFDVVERELVALLMRLYDIKKGASQSLTQKTDKSSINCPVCLWEVEDCYQLGACAHNLCRLCLIHQLESATRAHSNFPICCPYQGCGIKVCITDIIRLLSYKGFEKLLGVAFEVFISRNRDKYQFCPSPDCPSVYRVAERVGCLFRCGVCNAETCTRCHSEYHSNLSCEAYKQTKDATSLEEWRRGKEEVKSCPECNYTIEKTEGCDHVECMCGSHLCWVCLDSFSSGVECYAHIRAIHRRI